MPSAGGCRSGRRGSTGNSVTGLSVLFSTLCLTSNMKNSSIEMSSANTRPSPLSQVSRTGLPGATVVLSAVHIVSGPGTLIAASDDDQPNSA